MWGLGSKHDHHQQLFCSSRNFFLHFCSSNSIVLIGHGGPCVGRLTVFVLHRALLLERVPDYPVVVKAHGCIVGQVEEL